MGATELQGPVSSGLNYEGKNHLTVSESVLHCCGMKIWSGHHTSLVKTLGFLLKDNPSHLLMITLFF